MKIIKRGTLPEERVYRVTCSNCKSELEYTKEDVKLDFREGDYIVCPVCEKFIDHEN